MWTDGASRGNPGPAAVGVVIRDADGEDVDTIAETLGIQTNNYAEYEAIRRALARAVELGADEVTLHADSELAVRQLLGEYRVQSASLEPLWDAVKALESEIPNGVVYRHVRRAQNREADALANAALDADAGDPAESSDGDG